MTKTRYKIEITRDGKTTPYTSDFQTKIEFSRGWQSLLKKHHRQDAVVQCMCPGSGKREFAIKQSKAGLYFISRFGHSGINHFSDCVWYSTSSISGRQGYTEGVVEEEPDGTLRIKLAVSLKAKEPVERQPAEAPGDADRIAGRTKTVMKMLGLLHLLWTEASLNIWYPKMAKSRFIGSIHGWLDEAATRIRAGRTNLNEVLLIGAKEGSDKAESNKRKVASAIKLNRRLVVVCPLAAWRETYSDSDPKVHLRDFFGLPELAVDESLWRDTLRHHPVEKAAWKRGERIIAIALTDVPKNGSANVLHLALMYVSDRWIPLDSSLEGEVEARLAAESRSYMKPLRYDSEHDEVFADFHLLDTETNHLPMEVFGLGTPEYLARKAVKQGIYNQKYGANGWWYWDAFNSPSPETIPAFPPLRNK